MYFRNVPNPWGSEATVCQDCFTKASTMPAHLEGEESWEWKQPGRGLQDSLRISALNNSRPFSNSFATICHLAVFRLYSAIHARRFLSGIFRSPAGLQITCSAGKDRNYMELLEHALTLLAAQYELFCRSGCQCNARFFICWRIEFSQGDLMSIGTVSRNNFLAYSGATWDWWRQGDASGLCLT